MVLAVPLVCIVLSQAPTTPLTGIVVGPNGDPVAGAEVLLGGLPVYDPTIVARGRSDAQGRFTIERPAGLAGENRSITPILWVVKPGFRLGSSRFPGPLPKAGEAVRVVLGPPGKGEVRVEGPDGQPVAGARIRLESFGREQINVPEAVADLIEATTDNDGRAVIEAAANEEIAYVDVHAEGFGIQGRPFRPSTSQPKRVRLRPVASLEGRFRADDPAMLKGWRVLAYTYPGDRWSADPRTTGFAEGTTGAEGRFTFPAIAPGSLQLVVKPPGDLPVAADVPDALAVAAGRANSVVVLLRKTVTITGLVRERGTGRPVPGAVMHLSPARGGMVRTARTDDQGRYTFSCPPGTWHVSPFKLPPALIRAPGPPWKEITVSEGQGQLELEPWEAIPAAPPLRFIVRDEQGRPAAHASITGQSGSHYMPGTTDDNGEFAVPGLPPNSEVSVEVRLGDRMTDGPVKAIAVTPGPIVVTIVPGLTTALAGRVVGPGGTPIVDAQVRLQYREAAPQGGRFAFPQPLVLGDRYEVWTGTDGTFHTPKEIYRKGREFRAEVTAEGFLDGKTDWQSADGGERVTFPDLVLRPRPSPRLIAGQVVDRAGKGVPAVTVFLPSDSPARTEAITDDAGRFGIDGVPGGPALVFAERAGYRFGGAVVGPGDPTVEIRLARAEEPPISIPKPAPPPLSRAEERRIARELIAPLIGPGRAGSLGSMAHAVVPALARLDPDRVLEMLENRVLTQQTAKVLYQVALGQLEDDPDAAVATIEADRDPTARAEGFLALAGAATDAQGRLRLELIDRALAEARRVEEKESRLRLLRQVADRWLELGLVDRATPVLRQGRAIIATLPRDRFSFVAEEFAEVLAVIDLRTARTIFERKDPRNASRIEPAEVERHRGEAAVRLAAIDPAEAERLVPQAAPNFWARDDYLIRIAGRMTRVDLPRARRILGRLDEPSGSNVEPLPRRAAEGLALMAAERAGPDPNGARELLDEAFDRLEKVIIERNRYRSIDPGVANRMAALLPLVERIEPDRLEERLWLAAHRAPPSEPMYLNRLQGPVVLAALVARYDRAMAAAIIAPALDRLPGLLTEGFGFSYPQSAIIQALAVYDPRAVAAMVRDLPGSARRTPPPSNGWQGASIDAQIRLAAAEVLGLPMEERYRKLLGEPPSPHSGGRADRVRGSFSTSRRPDVHSILLKCLVRSLIALGCLGAQDPRQAVRFTGPSIPDPPGQKEAWTPPRTRLPRFLVAATSALFEQGVADPRGCEYREVEFAEGRTFKTRAFVLPERPGEAGRFAVDWDGVIRPASSVGPAADLDADIRELADAMRRGRNGAEGARAGRPGRAAGFGDAAWRGGRFGPGGPSGALAPSALQLCMLLRLGWADLAEELFAAGTAWTPEVRGRDLTDYHISYLTLAREWAAEMFTRLVDAHMRGDDPIALDAARRLSAFAKAAEARAAEMGFEREAARFGDDPPAYFPFLRQLPELLADLERRAREAPRGPVPPRGADPSARVAALIRDLDQIAMPQHTHFGNSVDGSPLVGALVAEGEAAVEPLLAAIETDTRLTRTVTSGRGISIDRRVHPVLEPEFAALAAILGTQQFSGQQYQVERGTLSRKELARALRDFWMKNRALSLTERWYRTLRDDSGGYARWAEAAAHIVQPSDQAGPAFLGMHVRAFGPSAAPMKGEELRSRRDPSVSELLARRVLEIARAPRQRTIPDVELQRACELALLLDRWDPKAALPVIRALMTQARESVDRDRSEGYSQFSTLVEYIARFTLIRARRGEPAALAEYAAELRKSDPEKDQPRGLEAFEPLWTYPDDPAIREAARWLFNDPGSPWAAFLRRPGSNRMSFLFNAGPFNAGLYASPLLRSPGFREAVLDALAMRTELGTARRSQPTLVEYELKDGIRGSFSATEADLEGVAQGVDQKIRACDYIAWQVSTIEGSPRCELYWTEEMRDAAVAACAAFLKAYGDRFTAEAPPGEHAPAFEKRAHLAFPVLDRPATKGDVRAGRAIFSLEGEGEVRRLELPLPLKAKWLPPEEAPGVGAVDGWVWQAEEVRKAGQWERYCGFVGRHVIARVPGGSIELAGGRPPAPGDR